MWFCILNVWGSCDSLTQPNRPYSHPAPPKTNQSGASRRLGAAARGPGPFLPPSFLVESFPLYVNIITHTQQTPNNPTNQPTTPKIKIEATFRDGTKLVTVHSPIALFDGNLTLALYGSGLPVPDAAVFGEQAEAEAAALVPGTYLYQKQNKNTNHKHTHAHSNQFSPQRDTPHTGQVLAPPGATVTINEGRAVVPLRVTNHADRPIQVNIKKGGGWHGEGNGSHLVGRMHSFMHTTTPHTQARARAFYEKNKPPIPPKSKPITLPPPFPPHAPLQQRQRQQVGSHYHFIETNAYLAFDRRRAYGRRLNLLAGA